MTGRIKAINERYFGFLISDDGTEWFFHGSVVEGGTSVFQQLREQDTVEFEGNANDRKGPRCTRVVLPGAYVHPSQRPTTPALTDPGSAA